jgi:hypothetical protein
MLELLENYPKSAQVIRQWFLHKLLESLKSDNLPEEFKESVKEINVDNNTVANVVKNYWRSLFDVFDNHKVVITISYNAGGKFYWEINDHPSNNELYSSRTAAEEAAVTKAFEILNNKL